MTKALPFIIIAILVVIGLILKWLASLSGAELAGVICLAAAVIAIVVLVRKNKTKTSVPPPVPFRIKESPRPSIPAEDLRPASQFPAGHLSKFIGKKPKVIIFVDLETNGLSSRNSVLSCSAIKCQVDPATRTITELDRFDRYYYPREKINPEAVNVNGLSMNAIKELRGSVDYPDHFIKDPAFREFCGPATRIVAHNCSFDLSFIPFFKGRSFCTMLHNTNVVCAQWMPWKGEYKWPTLLETAQHYGIPVNDDSLHSSSADVDITFQIFEKMLAKL